MYFTELQKKTIQERQIHPPVNKLDFLAFYITVEGTELCRTKEYKSILNRTPLFLVVLYLMRKFDGMFWKLADQGPTYCMPEAKMPQCTLLLFNDLVPPCPLRSGLIIWLLWDHNFLKAPFSKCFPSTSPVRFEEGSQKAPFLLGNFCGLKGGYL